MSHRHNKPIRKIASKEEGRSQHRGNYYPTSLVGGRDGTGWYSRRPATTRFDPIYSGGPVRPPCSNGLSEVSPDALHRGD